ncbi:RidA family protein [Chitinophaga tropicalis]|uniref:Reactive intermediate/imine deaminase n=1 Tax=Chitinophaga tropicalis TaxID=2683588 RepID=A0A7K1U327_9BACT|nr:Rid family detoxifying hydrolase [Chitinophaga tropicalis]MVT08767.1 hypothetical protein [Chitinophaga tropicalis]
MSNKIPYSPSLKTNDLLFISGQVGIDPAISKLKNESFESELRQVMDNLLTELKAHGLSFQDLVSTVIYLKDMKQYTELNNVYGSYFNGTYPTRTCIAVTDLPVGASVEISGIAQLK